MSSSLASSAAAASATPILDIVPPGYGAILPPGHPPSQPGDTGMTPIAPPPVLSSEQLAEDRSHEVYWSVAMMIIICTVFFGLRLYARYKTRIGLQPSDWILLGGIICAFGFGATYIWSAKEGAGRHFQFLVKQDPERTLLGLPYKAMFVASNIFFASVALVKLSILALYYEIFRASIRFRYAVWTLTTLVIAWWFICDPISELWDLSPNNKHSCLIGPHYLINGVSNVLTDFFILCLPVRMVWSIQLPTRARMGLVFIFLLGGIVCIASSFRLAYTFFVRDFDPSWHLTVIELWSSVEVTVAVVAARMLTMRPLLKSVIPGFVTRAASRWTSKSSSASRHSARRHTKRSGHISLVDNLTAKGQAGDAAATSGKNSVALDDLWQQGHVGPGGVGGGRQHAVSTRISARPVDSDRLTTEDSGETALDDEEKGGRGHIRVLQEGPFFSVESRRGSKPNEGSCTDVEAARGDGGSENDVSTKELCPRE